MAAVTTGSDEAGSADERPADPRAVRVRLGPASAHAGLEAAVVEPPAIVLAPGTHSGGAPSDEQPTPSGFGQGIAPVTGDGIVLVDGRPLAGRLVRHGAGRATLALGTGTGGARHRVLLGPQQADPSGAVRREVVVDGWLVQVELESERRAALRARAGRERGDAEGNGPAEVRAIIPGAVISVAVAAGDEVTAGQELLVVEAMKMQNELRAPRAGRIARVAVAPGQKIELGDVLVVLE